MKKNINAVNIEELASSISNTMERNLTMIQEVLDLDLADLIDILERQSNEDRDKIVSIIINNQLEKLQTSLTMKKYRDISRNVDDLTDYYSNKKESFDVVIEEGDYVADQLLLKVMKNKLELPIDISIIKKYCFSAELKEEQFCDVFMWIALRYIAISRCIIWRENKEKYEKKGIE